MFVRVLYEMRLLAPLLVVISCLAPVVVAQPPGEAAVEIKGVVINTATGQPIAGALVELDAGPRPVVKRAPADSPQLEDQADEPAVTMVPQEPQRMITSTSGSFSFSVFASRGTRLQVSRRGFQSEQETDVARVAVPFGDSRPLTVKLVPPGVIQGRVVNADGEALPGLAVEAVRVLVREGRREMRSYRSGATNDLGEYRLWNLPPASYYVKVVGRRGTYVRLTGTPQAGESDEAYGPVYFADAASQQSAQMVRIGGGETFRADFKVEGHAAYRIRGSILNVASNRGLAIRLLRGEDAMGNRANLNVVSGAFQVYDVTPGAYTLQVYSTDTGRILFGETEVSVQNGDLTGVSVSLGGGVDVSGVVDGLPEEGAFVTVRATPVRPARLPVTIPSLPAAPQGPNGDFTLKGLLPGKYDVAVTSYNDQYVDSVTSGDTDVLAEGLTLGTAAPPPLKITLRQGAGSIEGTVEDLGPGESAALALVRYDGRSVEAQPAYTAAGGKFRVPGLAPGAYAVYAWRPQQQIAYRDADVLARLSPSAASVSVQSGATAMVTVKLIEEQP
jgi:hypothetical protein